MHAWIGSADLPVRKYGREKVKLGETIYNLSGFGKNEEGNCKVAILELSADMDIDDQVEAVSEFSIKLLEISIGVVCLALWRNRAGSQRSRK